MKIRKLLAAALVLIMVFAAIPVFSLAEGVRTITYESRQMSKLDSVWAALDAAEAEALLISRNTKSGVINAVHQAALNLKHVDKDSFSDFTKDGFFFTVDGMQCAYNYRLRNELKSGATPVPANEGIQVFKPETEVEFTRAGNGPSSPNVLLIAPYYGHDSSFTNQYKTEAQSIANTTGGTYTLIQSTNATGPAIAQNYPNKGVVIYDSHGVQSGTSSYLCLTTSSGITTTDYNNGWAVRSGSEAFIDGRYVQNHANGTLSNCFVWMAICEGMKKGGRGTTGSALIAKGAAAVYGYSQSVSFKGDYLYEEVFWTQMKQGKTVATAIQAMKNSVGVSDPYTNPTAWPILMSPVDAFPSNPDGRQTVYCDWQLIGSGSSGSPINTVTLSNVSVSVGSSVRANLTVTPSNANYSTTWSTYNTSIATVDSSGYVRGVSAGTTTLSAVVRDNVTGSSYNRTATITVSGGSNPNPTPTPAPGTGYERVYSLENGGRYIFVADDSVSGSTGYAVGNTTVSSGRYLNPVAITVSNSYATVSSGLDAITWVASGNSSSGYTLRNVANNKYMGLDSAQYLFPSSTGVAWKYTIGYALDNQIDTDGYYFLSYSSNRYTTSKNSVAIRIYKVASGTVNPTPTPTPNTYTVTFKDWDGTILKTQQVAYGGYATPPATPTRPGYTFTGWDRAYSYITANTVITALYTENYNPNPTPTPTPAPNPGTGYERAYSIEDGGRYIIVAEGAISGSTGYAVGNTAVSNGRYLTPVAITLNTAYANVSSGVDAITWIASGNPSTGYTFRNVANSKYMGLDSAQYLYPSGTSVAWKYTTGYALDNQIDTEGYYYLSYSTGRYTTSKNSGQIRFYKVSSGSVNPTPNTYTVTFKDWDGTTLKTQQVAYGGAATPPAAPSRPGYTFTGWDRSYSYITANTVITALYTQNSSSSGYQRVTTITPGDNYILVAANSVSGSTGYAVGNTTVSNNRYLSPVAVTINADGSLTVPSSANLNAITWYAGGSSTYGYTFRNLGNSKYLGLDSAQYLYPSDTSVAWRYVNGALDNQVDTDGYFYLTYGTGRYSTSKSAGTIYIYKVG